MGPICSHILRSALNQHRDSENSGMMLVGWAFQIRGQPPRSEQLSNSCVYTCDRDCIWVPRFLQYCTAHAQHQHHPKSGQHGLHRLPLVPPHAHVADPRRDNPFVDVGLPAGLEPTFGLKASSVWCRQETTQPCGGNVPVCPKDCKDGGYPLTYHDHHHEDARLC